MVGLFISTSERMGHTPHPRPAIERDDRELRLFMVAPKIKYGSPAKNMETRSVSVPVERGDTKKASLTRQKRSPASTTTSNDRAIGTRTMTPTLGAGRVAYFQRVTQIEDNPRREKLTSPIPMEKGNRPTIWELDVINRGASIGDRDRLKMGRQ
jgi:hypothetical protein